MTRQFFNAASSIPVAPRAAAPASAKVLPHYSTQAARVIDEMNAQLMGVYNVRAQEAVRQVELDIRCFALSGASVSAVLETFRSKGYTASYDVERPHNGGEVIALSW